MELVFFVNNILISAKILSKKEIYKLLVTSKLFIYNKTERRVYELDYV